MNKLYVYLLSLLCLAGALAAQGQTTPGVGIGTTAPDASAALDIVSSTKGALLPRLTAADRTAMSNPAAGLILYQIDGNQAGFWYNAGTNAAPRWQRLTDSAGVSYDPATGLQVGPGPVRAGGTAGSTATGSSSFAVSPYGYDQRSAYVVRASLLLANGVQAGPINSLSFTITNKMSDTNFQGFTIKLANTALTTSISFLSTGTTTVFSANVTTALGLNTHVFTTPFVWDGTSNLYIETCYNGNTIGTSTGDFVATTTTTYTSFCRAISATPCTASSAISPNAALPLMRYGQPPGAYTLPALAGAAGQVLTQQASGAVAFQSPQWAQNGTSLYPTYLDSNVGIGTATPNARLEVRSDVAENGISLTSAALSKAISIRANSGGPYLSFNNASSSLANSSFYIQQRPTNHANSSHVAYHNEGGTSHIFSSGQASGVRVGIGQTNPLTQLHVGGTVMVDGGAIQQGGAAITGPTDLGLYSRGRAARCAL